MLVPAWRLPVVIVVLSLVVASLLPGVAPAPLFAGIAVAWLVAGALFALLHRRAEAST